MEIFISALDLQKALKIIGAVVKAGTIDVSGQMLIDASTNGDVVFLGTNNKNSITHVVDSCNVKSEGKICIAYSKLSSFVNSFPPWDGTKGVEHVHIKQLKNNISVKLVNVFESGKEAANKLTLLSYPVQNIYVPRPFKAPTFSISSAVLRLAISKVVYAINPNSPRPFIQGMNISFDDNYIYFAGTDALKLSEYKAKNTGKLLEGSYIIPYLFIMALRKITDNNSQLMFEIDDNQIKIIVNKTTLHGNLIIGELYPDYAPAFKKFTNLITVDKEVMLGGFIPYLSVLSEEDHKRLTIEIKDSKLRMHSEFSDSEYKGDVDFEGHFVIDINGSFLAQTLDAINDDIIEMSFSDENSVLIFDSGNFHDQKSLITPIKRRK